MIKKIYFLGTLLLCAFMVAQRPMIFKVNAQGGTGNINIKLCATGVSSGGSWSFPYTFVKVDNPMVQGKGSTALSPSEKILFPEAGQYIFSLYPSANGYKMALNFGNIQLSDADRAKILEIQQWGDITWDENLSRMFQGCSKLKITATDIPDFSKVTDMSLMFNGCSNLTSVPNIEKWNTGNVTDMWGLFWNCSSFNQDISQLNISKVTSLVGFFYGCTSFNQPLTWSTKNITNMNSMFAYANAFNQDISMWDTSKVTDMSFMFNESKSFNNDLNKWDVSNVENFTACFFGAISFNQNFKMWNLASAFKMVDMLANTNISCENYSITLKAWAERSSTPDEILLGANERQYGNAAKVYRDILIGQKSWTINGDVYDPSCSTVLVTKDVKLESVKISNPVKDFLIVQTTDNLGKIEIYSITGQLIKTIRTKSSSVSELAKGVYILKIFTDKGMSTQKIIKE